MEKVQLKRMNISSHSIPKGLVGENSLLQYMFSPRGVLDSIYVSCPCNGILTEAKW